MVLLLPVVVLLQVVVDDLVLGDGLLVVKAVGSGYAADVPQLGLLRGGLWWLGSVLGLVTGCVRRLLTAIICGFGRARLLVLLLLLVVLLSGVALSLAALGVIFGDGLTLVEGDLWLRLPRSERLMHFRD